LYECMTDR